MLEIASEFPTLETACIVETNRRQTYANKGKSPHWNRNRNGKACNEDKYVHWVINIHVHRVTESHTIDEPTNTLYKYDKIR